MYEPALKGRKDSLGSDHTSMLDTLNDQGVFFWRQGELDEAEERFQRALEGYQNALGLNHTSALGTINNLGLLY
jgi:Tfp pilus assembly protein PilF